VLLERPGEILTRDELRQRLWPSDVFVDFDHGLNKSVQKLRDALGDSATSPRYIETIPRVGYRFIAPVRNGTPAPSPRS
jgi:DNA-binding winged helix-turn-helix (wHTH) protein